jgi:hypothetical protein
VEGLAVAPFESLIGVKLTDPSGLTLAEAYPQVNAQMGQTGPYRQELDFSGVTEKTAARLTVYSTSPRDGGLVHLNSVIVHLLPDGEPRITMPETQHEAIEIHSPADGNTISGGEIIVSGYSAYFFEGTLFMILCAEGGGGGPHLICGNADGVLAESFTAINSPDIGMEGQFEDILQYSVDADVNARLVLYGVSPMDGAIEHLSSVTVTLKP